eukprot:TRINITY_DN47139_c0_g1_i1.p1 TRINITY_DN47139_c0_g1~~TRINITY_DN47139_c0_g1_i1.p1  ORF type:complete len:1638 (+),score=351.49 TRINITY_DN47139_c0_g1_i1:69-4916(+)
MCRLVAVVAHEPVLLADILTRPTSGLVRQSFASQERAQPGPGGPVRAYEQGCLNGDGYGLGWYVPSTCTPPPSSMEKADGNSLAVGGCEAEIETWTPALLASMKPAWNDRNLYNISQKVMSPLLFAHVRAAGPLLPVSDATCHPFRAGRLLFMHNGMIAGYSSLQPRFVASLCQHPTAFKVAVDHGLIDSAVAFGFLLVELGLGSATEQEIALKEFAPEALQQALERTIQYLCNIVESAGITEESLLNFAVTDGRCMVACRYTGKGSSQPSRCGAAAAGDPQDDDASTEVQDEPPQCTLYIATGTQWTVPAGEANGAYRMQQTDRRSRLAILSSEPLTSVRDEWLPVPRDTFVVITRSFDREGPARVLAGTVNVLFVPFASGRSCSVPICPLLRPTTGVCPKAASVQAGALPWTGSARNADGSPCDSPAMSVCDDPTSMDEESSGGDSPDASLGLSESAKMSKTMKGMLSDSGKHAEGGKKRPLQRRMAMEVLATEHSGIGEAPVLCLTEVPPTGVLVSGSQDGCIRFFDAEGGEPESRRHNGPVMSLLVAPGPGTSCGSRADPWIPERRGSWGSLEATKAKRQQSSDACVGMGLSKSFPQMAGEKAESDPEDTSCKAGVRRLGVTTRSAAPPTTLPDVLLFSAGTNELRIWDVSACAARAKGPWLAINCLFCFKFVPNQGRLLSMAGDCHALFLGFQSNQVCMLQLAPHWYELNNMKSKSRSIRFLTFDLARAQVAQPLRQAHTALQPEVYRDRSGGRGAAHTSRSPEPRSPGPSPRGTERWASPAPQKGCGGCCGPSPEKNPRFSYHDMLFLLDSPHRGTVHALAFHRELRMLASAGADGSLVFWRATAGHPGDEGANGHRHLPEKVPGDITCLSPAAFYEEGRTIFAMTLDEHSEELFVGDSAGQIRVWCLRSGAEGAGRKTVLSPSLRAAVLSLQLVAPDQEQKEGKRRSWLISGDTEGRIAIWDTVQCCLIQTIENQPLNCCGAVCARTCTPTGSALRLTCGGTRGGDHIFGGDATGSLQTLTLLQMEDEPNALSAARSMSRESVGRRGNRETEDTVLLTSLLGHFVSIQSHRERPDEMHRAASWLRGAFERYLGASVRVCADGTVLARCGWEPSRPLVVLYSHYDVVPANELDEWSTDPWKLTGKDGKFYGRGSTDCKGPLLAQMFAARRFLKGRDGAGGVDEASPFVLCGLDMESVEAAPKEPQADAASHSCPLVNILFVVDAAEESGSPGLLRAVREAREQGWLQAPPSKTPHSSTAGKGGGPDGEAPSESGPPLGLIVTNSTWIDDEHPCVCYGMRGVVDVDVCVKTGGSMDVHTGRAGLVSEPCMDLVAVLSSLTDGSGRVMVPGFDRKVTHLDEEELRHMEHVATTIGEERLCELLRDRLGLPEEEEDAPCSASSIYPPSTSGWSGKRAHGHGQGVDMLHRCWHLPALSIIEMSSGGGHTCGRLISREASARVSVRTVPDQEPEEIVSAIKQHLLFEFAKRRTANKMEITERSAHRWWLGAPGGLESSRLFRAARKGVQEAWELRREEDVLAVREGGTMPILAQLQAELGCHAIQIALGQASDAAHLPNERMSEKNLTKGMEAIWRTLVHLAHSSKPPPGCMRK